MTWFLDLRADPVGGYPAAQVMLRLGMGFYPNTGEFLQQIRGKHVLLATHGFNVNRFDGVSALSAWEPLLNLGANAVFIGVLWPGDSRWMPVLDYPFEDREAIHCAALLAQFVDAHFGSALSVSLVSHSLGARLVLETIKQLRRPSVALLALMAGAINHDCLVTTYRSSLDKVRRVAVLASHEDRVLQIAFPAGNPLAGMITQGSPYTGVALGRYGPAEPLPGNLGSPWAIPDPWHCNHGNYVGQASAITTLPADLPSHIQQTPQSMPGWTAAFVATQFGRACA